MWSLCVSDVADFLIFCSTALELSLQPSKRNARRFYAKRKRVLFCIFFCFCKKRPYATPLLVQKGRVFENTQHFLYSGNEVKLSRCWQKEKRPTLARVELRLHYTKNDYIIWVSSKPLPTMCCSTRTSHVRQWLDEARRYINTALR